MTRRLLLLLPFVPRLLAEDAAEQAYDLVTSLASRLSDDNLIGFMALVDPKLPEYEQLRANLQGLLAQAEVLSSIVVLANEGSGTERDLELDWFLQAKDRYETASITRRRETVKCRVTKTGKKWKVAAMSPLTIFAPVKSK